MKTPWQQITFICPICQASIGPIKTPAGERVNMAEALAPHLAEKHGR